MKMTTKGRYAVSTMCELAGAYSPGASRFLQAKDIAARHYLSELYVEQILNKLKRAGLIRAIRGPLGGYALSKKPALIKIGEILEATEGPISLVHCVTKSGQDICRLSAKCKTKKFWNKLNRVIQGVLYETTLADMC